MLLAASTECDQRARQYLEMQRLALRHVRQLNVPPPTIPLSLSEPLLHMKPLKDADRTFMPAAELDFHEQLSAPSIKLQRPGQTQIERVRAHEMGAVAALPPVLRGCGTALFGNEAALRRLFQQHVVIIEQRAPPELVHMARAANYRQFKLGGPEVRETAAAIRLTLARGLVAPSSTLPPRA